MTVLFPRTFALSSSTAGAAAVEEVVAAAAAAELGTRSVGS